MFVFLPGFPQMRDSAGTLINSPISRCTSRGWPRSLVPALWTSVCGVMKMLWSATGYLTPLISRTCWYGPVSEQLWLILTKSDACCSSHNSSSSGHLTVSSVFQAATMITSSGWHTPMTSATRMMAACWVIRNVFCAWEKTRCVGLAEIMWSPKSPRHAAAR